MEAQEGDLLEMTLIVADSRLQARSLHSQFGIFSLDCCPKCLVIVGEQIEAMHD